MFQVFIGFSSVAQEKFTLSGKITDSETGGRLPGASISVKGTTLGSAANHDGLYTLSLTKGDYLIVYRFMGYQELVKSINLSKNSVQNISLTPLTKNIDGVTIAAEAPDHNIKSTEMSVEKLTIRELKKFR